MLTGNSGANVLTGGTGSDTYVIDQADTVVENANEGIDTIQAGFSYTLGPNLENLTLTGAAAIDGTGNDVDNIITGNGANNVLSGGGGNDTLSGGGGNDTLLGGLGSDSLDGGAGADSLTGGADNDMYWVDDPGDSITELAGEGSDTVESSVTYTLGANLEYLELLGSGNINGTGNSLDNAMSGNIGDNVLSGDAGNDYLWGDAGNDTLLGGTGTDTMEGSTGDDTYEVDSSSDVVIEQVGEGVDTILAPVTRTLDANVENLTLTGTNPINGMGNSLANVLRGNSAANALSGGQGNDSYYVSTGDTVTESSGQGTDTVFADVSWTLGSNVENLTLLGTGNINATGNTLANVLTGNSGNNTLSGGTGADSMIGGAGDDTYVVDNAGDTVTEGAGGGTDLVQASVTYTLAAEVENLTLTGTSALNGTGNALNNTLTGNTGNNTLTGLAGNDFLDGGSGSDTMVGGTGDDTYVVAQTGDVVTENANEGTDTVQASITYTLGNNVENLLLTGSSALNGTGNTLNNSLIGNSGNNTLTGLAGNDVLDGGAGTDTMVGGTGDDTYVVAQAGDVVTENANEGIDTVQASITYTLGNNVENLTLTGTSAVNGTGNSLNNVLAGNSGINTLTGAAGNDTLKGAQGNDTLAGGTGNDTYQFDRGDGQDTVQENDATSGNTDTMLFGATINPIDLVLSQQGNDLRIALHGSTDRVTIQNWYTGTAAQTEVIQAANGQQLLNTQVATLIQAMATFTAQTGLTWDQGIDQQPQDVQTILAASWH